MISAREIPVSELPRAIAEVIYGNTVRIINNGNTITVPIGRVFGTYMEFDPFESNQFHELTGDPETHAKICDVLDEWFSQEPFYTNGVPSVDTPYSSKVEVYEGLGDTKLNPGWKWYKNPAYLTENGGWRAWWLRTYLQILMNERNT